MIERFNFYDVYGYFLPGLVFLTLIWLPFGLIQHFWPAKELSFAIATIVFAYVVGHLLQSLAHSALPSVTKDSQGKPRFPSDLVLDSDSTTFSKEFKAKLATIVTNAFALDLAIETPAAKIDDPITRRRQDAFFWSRAVLLKQEIAAYTEQFEGLYSLMRGLATAFGFGFAYITGWGLSYFKNQCFQIAAIVAILAGLIAATIMTAILQFTSSGRKNRSGIEKTNLALLMLVLLALGYRFGLQNVSTPHQLMIVWLISLGALFSFFRCFGAYKYFAQQFAQAVWRDFAAYMLTLPHP
jgi:hypothetical protein